MKKLIMGMSALVLLGSFSILSAEKATYCWHAKCKENGKITFWRDGCYNTGVHRPSIHYRYDNDSYYTKCRTGERNIVLNWAQNCAYFYNKFYTGYKNDSRYPCW